MSKHFGGGGGRRLEPKDYPPPRRGDVDKRPSVFDRLGVRKDNAPSSHSHYAGGDSGSGYRRNDGPGPMRKHSPMPGQMISGRRNQDARGDRIRSRSRSRSFSPRNRKVPSEIPHHHSHVGGGHGQMKKSKIKEIPPHDHRMRQRSNSPMRRKPGDKPVGVGSPKWREENPARHKGGVGPGGSKVKKGSGKKSGGKKSGKDKERKAGKGRSSSGSSGSSGETSSSSRSASSSSSTSEASSSTSSNASSSSDSSVPSIKLRHDTKKKVKKVKPRPSSRSESVSTGQIQSRVSSGSSIESGNVRDNRDLREKIKAKTRQNYERIQDGTPDLRHQRRPPQEPYPNRNYNKTDIREDSPGSARRRRPSGASSFSEKPVKRRRVLSPEEFVPSPRRAPPPNDPPVPTHPVRRDRSPLPRDRIRVINSPMRRAPAEDTRRGDVRDINKRLDNYGDNKPRDVDRFRDDAGPYGRDSNRQKERLAPARPLLPVRHPGPVNQMNPDRARDNREMNDRPGNNRFEPRHSRPLLQLPPGAEPQKIPYRGAPDDRVPRLAIQPQSPALTKPSPMIVKSKEALIEKYRIMKPSQYVDMWVDKTVEACAPPGSSIVSPPKDTPSVSSRTFDDSAETGTKVSSTKDIDDLLSDFSDDADDLLNDVGDEPKSEKSEKEIVEKKAIECEAEVASTVTVSQSVEVTTPVEKKPTPSTTVVSVVTPVISQDRKSVGTPQRTSSSFIEPRGEGESLPSRSQTEDDILERMDFEEISDEELGDVGENKIPIVDALGVDWASLVCGEKNRPVSPSSVLSTASTSMKVRKRWTPLQVVSRVGLLSNCSEKLLQKVVELKMKEEPYSESSEDPMDLEEKIQDELQNAGKFRKMRARGNVIDTIGLGPNSRALSSRRDMALRRYYLGMPQKSLVSMDMLHQNPASNSVQDLESIGELYRLSLSLFKGSETATVTV
ncbi:unnamed protein product [Orchesella dallaii]|uniref:Zinc finger CCCH domain-containing protein 13 n=1 Tax=Orchesella dallaii TaxID=48710 RepID=A0ABP1R412_9HEXA